MTTDLSDLIARLEDGPVYLTHKEAYDLAIFFGSDEALGMASMIRKALAGGSLDAALALAERVLPEGRMIGIQQNRWSDPVEQKRRAWTAFIEWREDGENFEISPVAPAPALALCIAILKAKKAEGEVNKNPKAQEG